MLIVDDAPHSLAALRELLEETGYTVGVEADATHALQRARRERPDIILLDAMMPGMDGFELARRLKADELTAAIPLVFMTGIAEAGHWLEALAAGAVDYVTKPIKPHEVAARIGVHVRTARRSTSNVPGAAPAPRTALDAMGYATITVRMRDGRLLWETPLARELLRRYCGTEAPQTPEVVLRWLRHCAASSAQADGEPPRLTLQRGVQRLTLRLYRSVDDPADDSPESEGGHWMIVMQESSDTRVLQPLMDVMGLSARQAEALYWVAQGKSIPVVAAMLGVRPSTVRQHLARITTKLHVPVDVAVARARQCVPQLTPAAPPPQRPPSC